MASKLEQIFLSSKDPIPRDWKMIGYFDSPETTINLNLMALSLGISKSRLLRNIVAEWLSTNDAFQAIVTRIKALRDSEEGKGMDAREFHTKVESLLKEKKIPKELRERILKSI